MLIVILLFAGRRISARVRRDDHSRGGTNDPSNFNFLCLWTPF